MGFNLIFTLINIDINILMSMFSLDKLKKVCYNIIINQEEEEKNDKFCGGVGWHQYRQG